MTAGWRKSAMENSILSDQASSLKMMVRDALEDGQLSSYDRTRIDSDELEQIAREQIATDLRFGNLRLSCPSGVYHPDLKSSSLFLLRHLRNEIENPKGMILELGVGSGVVLLSLAGQFPNSTCIGVDIDLKALNAARKNASLNGIQVDLRRSDLFSAINRDEQFDLIVFNPPLFDKTPVSEIENRALCDPGGKLLGRYLDDVGKFLRPGGSAYCVISNIGDLSSLQKTMHQIKLVGAELFGSGQILGLLKIQTEC